MLRITTRAESDHQLLERFRKAATLAFKPSDKPKKTCFYCQKTKYPEEAFYPHKSLDSADYCPDCKLLEELDKQVFTDYWIGQEKTPLF
jgi:hypothetical protein